MRLFFDINGIPIRALLVTAVTFFVSAGFTTRAAAAEYTLFIYESPAEFSKRGDRTEIGKTYWSNFAQYGEALKKAGVLRGGAVLQGSADAKTVSLRKGQNGKQGQAARTDHSSKEQLGGYFIIDVPNMEAAVEWARQVPSAITGSVEIRPAYPAPNMAATQ